MLEPDAFVLPSAKSEFREVPLALSGYAKDEAGEPCHYLKRELIPLNDRRTHPVDGYEILVTPERAEKWVNNFRLMSERGHAVPAPPAHNDPNNSFGKWISLSTEPNAKGGKSLYGVLKVVGDRTKEDVLNRDVSIYVTKGEKDDKGNQYDEALNHVAITPYAAVTGLSGWTSIAASRGPAVQVPVLSSAASHKESIMDLSQLREITGSAKETPDDQVIALACSRLKETKTALDAATTAKTTAEAEVATLKTAKTAADAKVLELSRAPDPSILADAADLKAQRIDLALERGQCSKAQADLLKGALKDGDKPAALMLSKSGTHGTPIDLCLKVLELNKGFTGIMTGNQPLPDPSSAEAQELNALYEQAKGKK